MDLPTYDLIFTGMPDEQCKQFLLEKRKPDISERGPSISWLKGKVRSSLGGKHLLKSICLSTNFVFYRSRNFENCVPTWEPGFRNK